MAALELKAKDQSEFIYLPFPDIEIEKALMRLGVSYLQDCKLYLDSHNLPDKVLGMIPDSDSIVERLDILNKVSDIFLEMDGDIEYFGELMDYIKPSNIDEIFLLAETMYEFEVYDGIRDAEGYGRHMICESGHFEYDHNLEDYIDFKKYGQEKIANETGAFTEKRYLIYYGYNQKLLTDIP
ncbi:MAG TPA: antirestriction protein ArdA [Tissierellales bacterium]|nr:antirestriction protein ArdA [Tissierellales bacterium]